MTQFRKGNYSPIVFLAAHYRSIKDWLLKSQETVHHNLENITSHVYIAEL